MAKFIFVYCVMFFIIINSLLQQTTALPRPQPLPQPRPQPLPLPLPQQAITDPDSEVEELENASEVGENEKDDLNGASSLGYGYYSSPYLGGYYGGFGGGGYYPHSYSYGLGYPHYGGGYYGGHHGYLGYHGHYF